MVEAARPGPGQNIDVALEMQEAKQAGKSYLSVMTEVYGLARGPGKLTLREYLHYRVWQHPKERQGEFVGKKAWPLLWTRIANQIYWGVLHEKLICYALLDKFGFPIPKILGLYDKERAYDVPLCRNAEEVTALLKGLTFPVFAKPTSGMYSVGTYRIEGFDGTEMATQEGPLSVAQLLSSEAPYIFQEVLTPHPEIAPISDKIASLRLVVLFDREPEILRSLWKIPTGKNVADNYWRGNLLALVEEGRVTRVIDGTRSEVTEHPDNAQPLLIALPCYQEAVDLALACARVFPEIRLQAYDIALTAAGPKIIEINVGGDFDLPQLASGQGFVSGRFRDYLKAQDAKAQA